MGEGNGVKVADGRAVALGGGGNVGRRVWVAVGTGGNVSATVGVAVDVRLGRGVLVTLGVVVYVGVRLGVAVRVGVRVVVGVRVPVGVALGVGVRVAVCVGVRLGGVSNAILVASHVGEATTVGVLGASMFSEQLAANSPPLNNTPSRKKGKRFIHSAYNVLRERSTKDGQALPSRAPGRSLGVQTVC